MTVLGVFGKGEARELGLGPDVIEAVRPRLSPFWIDSFFGCDKYDDASLNPRASTSTDITASSFSPDTVFVQVAAGGSCSFALTATGLVYAWGSFRTPEGEEALSRNPDSSAIVLRQPTPVCIQGLAGITQIAAGTNHALALEGRVEDHSPEAPSHKAADGTKRQGFRKSRTRLWAWGCGDQNQPRHRLLPRHCPQDTKGCVLLAAAEPQIVETGSSGDNRFFASDEYHEFAIDACGQVWAQGLNLFGKMGAKPDAPQRRGTTIARPMQVAALTDQCGIALTRGGHHPVAVTADGRCLAWGRVDSGQLGVELDAAQITDETLVMTDDSGRPHICLRAVVVGSDSLAPDEKVIGVACDTRHTLIVASVASHVVLCAGFHMPAQLGLSRDADDEVSFATRLGGKVLQQRGMAWACAGGQFSMVAGPRPCS